MCGEFPLNRYKNLVNIDILSSNQDQNTINNKHHVGRLYCGYWKRHNSELCHLLNEKAENH